MDDYYFTASGKAIPAPVYKYFKGRDHDVYVTYVFEGNGKTTEHARQACYASIFRQVPEWVKSILLKENMSRVGYDEPEIKRWIDDLNEMGFPCHLEGVDETVRIRLVMDEFKSKVHLCSTLSLMRLLWEGYYSKIPEIYFTALDENPEADKIEVLQVAHKKGGAGQGHCVTGTFNGTPNVERKLLLERLSEGMGIHAVKNDYSMVNKAWLSPEAKQKGAYAGQYE